MLSSWAASVVSSVLSSSPAFCTLGLWGMGRGGEFVKVTGYFMMNAIAVLFEDSWKKFTGSHVDGFLAVSGYSFGLSDEETSSSTPGARKALLFDGEASVQTRLSRTGA